MYVGLHHDGCDRFGSCEWYFIVMMLVTTMPPSKRFFYAVVFIIHYGYGVYGFDFCRVTLFEQFCGSGWFWCFLGSSPSSQ